MKSRLARVVLFVAASISMLFACASPSAQAAFGLHDVDVRFTNADGSPVTQAGSHPFAMTTSFSVNTRVDPKSGLVVPDGELKDLRIDQIPGLVGNPTAVPRCSNIDFLTIVVGHGNLCSPQNAVGRVRLHVVSAATLFDLPVYNLNPGPGSAAKFGFTVLNDPVTIDVKVNEAAPFNISAMLFNIPQPVPLFDSEVTLWGDPANPAHDKERGVCTTPGGCPFDSEDKPFLTLPRSCSGPLATAYTATSWQEPDAAAVSGSVLTHNDALPPAPQGMTGCGRLGFSPSTTAKPTTLAAESSTGLDFSLDVHDEGLTNPSGLAQSDIAKTVVTLPEGMTVNPSSANGINVCSEAELHEMSALSEPGVGCPDASKLGSVEVETPLLEGKLLKGGLFLATPYQNPFGSLISLYIVIQNPELGIFIVQPLRVEPNPATGQLVTTAEDMPELPFSHFRLHFREGARSPLVSPAACGSHQVKSMLYPSSGGAPVQSSASFEIISGPAAGPCPAGGLPPFHPDLDAGTESNAGGRFSPFDVKITRTDSEQEITHFSIKLPPGVAAKLAGVSFCSDAQIAAATARTGNHGGQEELEDPSCPAASQVGRSLAGAGVGSVLTYVPGKVYLAGPYHGHPVSLVAITSGVAGPFDIGTVVVRLAIDVNPETGEVFLDSTGSDPLPHIVKGIPVHLRDIRAYTDRPEFTFNPTNCEPTATAATVLGSGLDFVSPADDNPFVSTSRFQAADCAALTFEPKLRFKLKGGTKRGANPSLRAHVAMNGFGEAAIRYAQVTLPKSEFLEQGHIGTICTRVQFKEGSVPGERCPAASVYGKVVARTPILDEPLSGPIFLRSSEHELPDLVAALHGSQIDVSLVGRIDSGKNGGIRNTFEFVPDAPVASADFTFFGGKKSLLSNSRNLCKSTNKVKVFLKAHSGKRVSYKTPLRPLGCEKKHQSKRHARRR
jgi:hypothetical protein